LHDYCLHHALHQYCQRKALDTGQYREQVALECGEAATAIYDRLAATSSLQLWWHYEISRFPVYRWAIRDTLGVITHAEFYRAIVSERIGCPTACLPLAYDTPCVSELPKTASPTDKLTILTVGAVNANKRYEAVIRALAESPLLRERCRYRVVGAASPAQQRMIQLALQAQPQQLEVTLTGQVPRQQLERELAEADIISCLRYPALEGASASVVEGLLSGKPVIVCDTGCYQEIPDDLVMKVAPDREHTQLTRALEHIVNDPAQATARAKRARAWAVERHAPSAYARSVLEFAEHVLYQRPVLQVADRLAQQLESWQSQPDSDLLRRIDQVMEQTFADMASRRPADRRAA
jgi:glycosyltransferase involved in cell wall biosynthesis